MIVAGIFCIIAYLVLGIIAAVILKQTPYALNPLWVMIFGWPLYFRGVAALFLAAVALVLSIVWWFA